MPIPDKSKLTLTLRLKIAAVSLLGLFVPSSCAPTCYIVTVPTDTPMPLVTCYTAPPPTETPTPTTFTSPLSPLPTPTPTLTPEARRLLMDELLTEGRFPQDVVRQLKG
jgi:hypothetical protein